MAALNLARGHVHHPHGVAEFGARSGTDDQLGTIRREREVMDIPLALVRRAPEEGIPAGVEVIQSDPVGPGGGSQKIAMGREDHMCWVLRGFGESAQQSPARDIP